jgi:hypothetical protein
VGRLNDDIKGDTTLWQVHSAEWELRCYDLPVVK